MSRIEVLRYTAFTSVPDGGNPAGLVLDASALTDAAMQAIAAEVGYSETAFLFPDAADPRAFEARYFAPCAEVAFCGHATIAAGVALGERLGPGRFVLRTRAGSVPVVAEADADGRLRAALTSVQPDLTDLPDADLVAVLAALHWSRSDLDPALPPRVAYAGVRHPVIAAATRERLADLHYDFDALHTLMRGRGWTTLQLVWRAASDTFFVRDPFPVGGVVEDPATGAAAAAFGHYLRELDLITLPVRLTLHQGDDLGRPSVLTVDVDDGDPRIRVSGHAVRLATS